MYCAQPSEIRRRTSRRFLALTALAAVWLVGAPGVDAAKPRPSRPERSVVGHAEPYVLVPDLTAATSEGSRTVWRHRVDGKGASFVKLHLADVNLRAGDTLRFRAASGRLVEEIRGRGPKDRGTFWTLSAFGDHAELELEFGRSYERPPFSIDRVLFGNGRVLAPVPDGGPGGPEEDICAPADFEDAVCYATDAGKWANVQASVGVMTVGGDPDRALFCSGSNVSPDNHVLTNEHCISTQNECDNSEFVFRHFRTGCGDGSPPTDDWQSFRCDEILVRSPFIACEHGLGDLDFTLASVIGDPASTFGFAEVDPDPIVSGEDLYIVQHPDGRPQEITHGGGKDVIVDGTILRYFGTLDTEPGSSGSPIFRESDDRLVGLHHCGGCDTQFGNRGMLSSDIYPAIADFVCSNDVVLRSAGYDDLVEVDGNGDTVIDPGETWRFRPRVRNSACAAIALDVTAEVVVNPLSDGPISLSGARVAFGDIAPGAVAAAEVPVSFTIHPLAPCGGEILFDLVDIMADGGPAGVDFSLFARQEIGMNPVTTLLFEDFVAPEGWTFVDGGVGTGPAQTWTRENPGGRDVGLTEPFAIADSDALGPDGEMDERLVSPAIDTSGFSQVILQFTHSFTWYSGGEDEQADVAIRTGPGEPWITVANFSGETSIGTVSLDITDVAADATELQIGFRYYNASYEWWWAIDDVFVLASNGFVCSEPELSPELTITHAGCPGPVRIELANLTPFGPVAVGIADTADGFTVPNGNCAGLDVDLGPPRRVKVVDARPDGTLSRDFDVGAPTCERFVQALDLTTCQPSAVERVAP